MCFSSNNFKDRQTYLCLRIDQTPMPMLVFVGQQLCQGYISHAKAVFTHLLRVQQWSLRMQREVFSVRVVDE